MSSFVPTLSLAYSTKAVGINQEVYGTQDYCVRPEAITPHEVVERIVDMLDNRERIRNHLEGRIPRIREMVYKAGSILGQLLGEQQG
jgi:polysaccharide pyruvyl transferase WcaK-like protein